MAFLCGSVSLHSPSHSHNLTLGIWPLDAMTERNKQKISKNTRKMRGKNENKIRERIVCPNGKDTPKVVCRRAFMLVQRTPKRICYIV